MNTHAVLGTDLSSASEKLIECAHEYKNLGVKKITLVHSLGLSHILLPTDFSDSVEQTHQWLKSREVPLPKLTLMHVQDSVKIGKHLKDKLDEFNRIDTERFERLKKSFNEAHPETEIEIVLEYGKPTQKILNYIKEKEVCLTVMGSQGRGYIPEIFLGSVSHQVARHSDSNVLFVPLPRH